jgi:hypothetical protein
MDESFGQAEIAHDWFGVSRMEVPAFLECARVFNRHPHILAEMLGPSGYKVLETKQAGLV